jgi:two-component system nitrate/nitrite sensor histidine kinase NarQ
MGLPGVLRGLTDRMVVVWQGTCQVEITGVAVPINSTIQLEVYRIAREALINAVKHADATVITVHLHYPACPDDPLTLIVADNGCSGKPIELRPGHWGIRNMMESARVAGGELHFAQALGGGTEVVLTFHASRGGADVPRERPIIGRQVRTA